MHPKQEIKDILKELTDEDFEIKDSPITDFRSSVAFKLASALKKSPKVIADEIAEKLNEKLHASVSRVESTNGYINFYLNYKNFSKEVLSELHEKKENFGKFKNKNLKIILEHTLVNHSMHVYISRLRN